MIGIPARIGKVTRKGRENVIVAGIVTRLDMDAVQVLAAAAEHGLQSVVIVGYDADGQEYFASSLADAADALWLLERCKHTLVSGENA